jgi:hypothetical protein
MRLFAKALTGALVVWASHTASAQSEGPVAGTWGAEAANGGSAALLRFRSPNSAWLLGFNGAYARVVSEFTNPVTGPTESTDEDWFAQTRVGMRWYSTSETRLRRFSTLAATVGYNGGDGAGWVLGASGELGAAWFFTPHVSLGTSAELSASRLTGDTNGSSSFLREYLSVQVSGFRLLGAVYF